MNEITMIGVNLAKSVFQALGATAIGEPVFQKKLSRGQFLKFLSEQRPCVVAMEACASSHYWGREIMKLRHDVRLIRPIFVKPFVKRQKNDADDAEVISEAAVPPTMRLCPSNQPSNNLGLWSLKRVTCSFATAMQSSMPCVAI